jgi:two-component system, cell cycle sensor histidine kinase and response regulator CckA
VRRTDDREEIAHDIHDTIADLTRIMDPLLGKMTLLSLALNAQDGRVALDGGSLSQIVMNLVVNARDAMPGGGALAITTRNVTRRSTTQAAAVDYLVLEVSDTGTGMTPDVRARVFEPFFTTKGPDAGTGLGLSTVFDIVRQAEGHIELDTIEGRGTTVRVLLPLARSRGESRCA